MTNPVSPFSSILSRTASNTAYVTTRRTHSDPRPGYLQLIAFGLVLSQMRGGEATNRTVNSPSRFEPLSLETQTHSQHLMMNTSKYDHQTSSPPYFPIPCDEHPPSFMVEDRDVSSLVTVNPTHLFKTS